MSKLALTFATMVSAVALVACGGSPGEDEEGGNEVEGSGGGSSSGGGCLSAPNCGGCQQCFDNCVCQTGDVAGCVNACGTGSGGGPGAGGGPGTGGGPGAGGGPGVGGGPGAGGTGSGGTGGDPGNGVKTATIATIPVSAQPGQEIYKCQNFKNPFGGKDIAVLRSESFMTPGSHHMFVFYDDGNADSGTQDCSGLEYGTTIHSAARPQQSNNYPDGVGRLVSGNQGFRILVHYLNSTQQAVDMEIQVVFEYTEDPGSLTGIAGSVFMNNVLIGVPPHSPGNATKTCAIPHDIQLLGTASHMHQFGTYFKATTNTGTVLYEGTEWNEPEPWEFDPPMHLPAGSVTFSCDYNNPTSGYLTFGDSFNDEMCILAGTYYRNGGDGSTIGCVF